MPVRRTVSPYPRPQSWLPRAVYRLEEHHEHSGYPRMSERTAAGADRYDYNGGDRGLGSAVPLSPMQNSNAVGRGISHSYAEIVDSPRPRLRVRNPDESRRVDEYTTASDTSTSDDLVDEGEYANVYYQSSGEDIQDARLITTDVDVYRESFRYDWLDFPRMGRIERARFVRPWRTLQQMYRIQTCALRAAINAEALQDVAEIQRNYDCVVELSSADERESYENLSSRFGNTDAFRDGLDDSWNAYTYNSGNGTSFIDENGGLISDMTWFFDEASLPLNVRYNNRARNQHRRTRVRERLANSVLSLGSASQSFIEWCPCLNLGPGPEMLREEYCEAIRARRHCQRRLLEGAYAPESRGCMMEDGYEADLYIRYILAAAEEQFLERQWKNAPLSNRDSTEEALDALVELALNIEEDPIISGEVEEVLHSARYTANHPSELWPCFRTRR